MDFRPNLRRFWVLIGLSLFFTAKAELYCSFEILPIENKIYVRDGKTSSWAFFEYPKYVRIKRTYTFETTGVDIDKPTYDQWYIKKEVVYENIEDPWMEHVTSWVIFNNAYNNIE